MLPGKVPLDPDKIRARRDKLTLTQEEAARKAGMHQTEWARIETGGRVDPKLSTALRIAAALECQITELLKV